LKRTTTYSEQQQE